MNSHTFARAPSFDHITRPDAASAADENFGLAMVQYLKIKAENQDYVLFFRFGDFYLLFFNDAEVAAKCAGMALKLAKYGENDLHICGVPVEAGDLYMQRLVRAGLSLAICEEVELLAYARKRGAPFVVRREVVRLIRPSLWGEARPR